VSARVLAGADAFRFDGGAVGVLLVHGFTGSPASLRPMGEWLSARGVSVVGPRLPGHGTAVEDLSTTTWRDWEREAEAALTDLAARCSPVIAAGLSMGGAMALHLGAKRPDAIRGVVAINPYVQDPRLATATIARLFMRTTKGVINDIKKPGQDEVGYERVPVRTLVSLNEFLKTTVGELPSMTLPLLVFSSDEDHVIKPANSRLVIDRAGSSQKELVRLPNSYHVATLDFDSATIFERTLAFANALA